jgi:hypothetical protein
MNAAGVEAAPAPRREWNVCICDGLTFYPEDILSFVLIIFVLMLYDNITSW